MNYCFIKAFAALKIILGNGTFHTEYFSDHIPVSQPHKLIKCPKINKHQFFYKNHSLLACLVKKSLQCIRIQGQRRITDHIFPLFYRPFNIIHTMLQPAPDIYNIDSGQKFLIIRFTGIQFIFFTEFLCGLLFLRKNAFHVNTADIPGFFHDSTILIIFGHNSNPVNRPLIPNLCTGNILGSWKISHFTIVLQIIEFPFPVRTDHQNVNIIFNNIVDLLSLIFLNNNLVCQPCPAHILDSLQQAVLYIQFSPLNIITLTGHTNDQIIAQLFCPFDNIVMTLMKKIKGPVSNDFFHDFTLFVRTSDSTNLFSYYLPNHPYYNKSPYNRRYHPSIVRGCSPLL